MHRGHCHASTWFLFMMYYSFNICFMAKYTITFKCPQKSQTKIGALTLIYLQTIIKIVNMSPKPMVELVATCNN